MVLLRWCFLLVTTWSNPKQLVLGGGDAKEGCKNLFTPCTLPPKKDDFEQTSLEWKIEPKSEKGNQRKVFSRKAERISGQMKPEAPLKTPFLARKAEALSASI